jgi:hypothetical protein
VKILLFVPTYRAEGGLAMFEQTRSSLDALEYGEHDVTQWISVDETPNRKENIFLQYERAWERARAEDFDAILTIEHDMIIPPDALVKLAEVDADICYGVYLFRETATLNAMFAGDDALLVGSLDNHPDERARAFESAGSWPVAGAGFGCTLIRRSVFESIDLRKPRGGSFPDLPLAYDTAKAGLRQAAHFGVLCGHICPDGFELWPAADQIAALSYTLPCRILAPFTGYSGNNLRWRMRGGVGDIVDVPARCAGRLARMGMIEILPRKDK